MNAVKQLLSQFPDPQQKSYQLYLQRHLKSILLQISKARLNDITDILLRKNKCISQCYKKYYNQNVVEDNDIYDTLDNIRQCKQRCSKEKQSIKAFLQGVQFLSLKKFNRCTKKCGDNQYSQQDNQCMWNCLNKIYRRYKKYWPDEKQKIIDKFNNTL